MQPEHDQRKRGSGKRGFGGENLRGKGDRRKATTPCPLGLSPPFRGEKCVLIFLGRLLGVFSAVKFRFMILPIIAQYRCIVNKNAIALLTTHQKYYGLKLLYQRRT